MQTKELSENFIERVKSGKTYKYYSITGKEITSDKEIQRFNSLGIPPAYKNIKISSDPYSHIQAIAEDARGRLQYRYHPKWIELRGEMKFQKMVDFGLALPKIRASIARDLSQYQLNETRAYAGILRMMELTRIRIGSEEYAQENGTYGLTTLLKKHMKLKEDSFTLKFVGKSSKEHEITVDDPVLVKFMKELKSSESDHLFSYLDENGDWQRVDAAAVNDYLSDISGGDFTVKDFRTWHGTVSAAESLNHAPIPENDKQKIEIIKLAFEDAAETLGNTPSIAKKSYVAPVVIEAYENGDAFDEAFLFARKNKIKGLSTTERAILKILETK